MMLIHSPPGICSDFYVSKCARTIVRFVWRGRPWVVWAVAGERPGFGGWVAARPIPIDDVRLP
jgi:hypothetical protein